MHNAMQCNAMQYDAMQSNAAQHRTERLFIIQPNDLAHIHGFDMF